MTATLETNTTEPTGEGGAQADLALLYAGDIIHRALLDAGVPLKVSEAARAAKRPDVDLRLARVVLASLPERFAASDRKWTLVTRHADAHRPIERLIEDLLESCGQPLPASVVAGELAAVTGRQTEAMLAVAERLLGNPERFVRIGEHGYARTCWLLDVQSDEPEDVLFDNFLEDQDVAPYDAPASTIQPGDPTSVAAFLDRVNAPVPSKVLQYLAWRTDRQNFDPATFVAALLDTGSVCLSNRTWIGPAVAAALAGHFPAIAERPVSDEVRAGSEVAEPLTISDEEREQLVSFVLRSNMTSFVQQMLEDIFEITEAEPTFEADRQTVRTCLQSDPRVVWVGDDRFLPTGAIPDYVFTVPESLHFVEAQYLDAEGVETDILLDDAGLSGGLKAEIMSPLVQDVLDEEPIEQPEGDAPVTVRCVLRFHHKEIGTFPLCQLPPGYFPSETNIVQVDVELPNSQVAQAWVNHDTRLMYGLLEWYETVPIDSGAVFYIERKAPDRYVITGGEETEPDMFVSRNRLTDLFTLRTQAEEEDMSVFDILRAIMEHYRKGLPFITALTEVNIVRRTRRRSLASLLSGYHCFFQRDRRWVFDPRKLSQGFDRSKRKYLISR